MVLKKNISILFLLTYLFLTTEFSQLLKLPLLVEHFIQHKAENNKITFFDFLSLHYKTTNANDADDMKLPFKSSSIFITSNLSFHIFHSFDHSFSYLLPFISKDYIIKEVFFINSTSISSIWQPPKLV